ncbi:MAG: UvrB/UvrC motif-containing protein [Candidatus Omnitrophota bacterium]|nr:UvrB/UvrC motif-containing protein [Candidatus Omnitrophota bacterium]
MRVLNMLCDICHKNIATVHLTEIVNDKVMEMHICQSCAKSKTQELKEQFNISDLLGGLVDTVGVRKEDGLLKCQFCGLTYADFRKKGRLGCAICYSTFKIQLTPLLKKIHSSIHHTGKFPIQVATKVSIGTKIKELKERLERAIKLEEYEEAVHLRDEIRKLESEGKK